MSYGAIVHIDMQKELQPLDAKCMGPQVLIVFWFGDIPLGHAFVATNDLPLSARVLRNVAQRATMGAVAVYSGLTPRNSAKPWADLEQIQCAEVLSNVRPQDVSLVVATRDRTEQLARCLSSIQALRGSPREILVVHNSTNSASDVRCPRGVRLIETSIVGSSQARNLGVSQTTGSIVAFVDDDETVHPSWLSRLTAAFNDPQIELVTGLVLPMELETESQVLFEKRLSFIRGYVPRRFDARFQSKHRYRGLPVWRIGGSGNMAVRRASFERVGGFDERLGAGRAG